MRLIVNTTVLSNFAFVERPELFRIGCPEGVVTAVQVMEEIRTGVAKGVLPSCDWDWLPVWTLDTAEEKRLFEQIGRRLGRGEAACLALAISRGLKFLTDDADARRWAQRAALPVSGTIGILVRLVQSGTLTLAEGNNLLTAMRPVGSRTSPAMSRKTRWSS